MTLRLNRRSESGLVPYLPPRGQDWRGVLRSSAWQGRPRGIRGLWARQTGERWGVRSLDNASVKPVSPLQAVVVFALLGIATFLVLALFHFLGIWS